VARKPLPQTRTKYQARTESDRRGNDTRVFYDRHAG
jgi:hypothetical protein